ncbi:predicted protein [Plenodomus lingam JN3]|uniref:Predicted protein n=1 Tax=Leptosphaeria maculans (strain JN3 / isolate v23.1.3 / race Av1-4-5-6-7-8) TaxID=985895 RepID=E4ZPK0_LEPMJ|nr:predicted protein [Plenodomus lingam JN3]CBX93225.1 predicted protein [Plenodomus lingam JN3]
MASEQSAGPGEWTWAIIAIATLPNGERWHEGARCVAGPWGRIAWWYFVCGHSAGAHVVYRSAMMIFPRGEATLSPFVMMMHCSSLNGFFGLLLSPVRPSCSAAGSEVAESVLPTVLKRLPRPDGGSQCLYAGRPVYPIEMSFVAVPNKKTDSCMWATGPKRAMRSSLALIGTETGFHGLPTEDLAASNSSGTVHTASAGNASRRQCAKAAAASKGAVMGRWLQ